MFYHLPRVYSNNGMSGLYEKDYNLAIISHYNYAWTATDNERIKLCVLPIITVALFMIGTHFIYGMAIKISILYAISYLLISLILTLVAIFIRKKHK